MSRRADVVEEQLLLGLLNGGLLGGGLLVEGRGSGTIRFRRVPWFFWVPDSGEVLVEQTAGAETVVHVQACCRTIRAASGLVGGICALVTGLGATVIGGSCWWAWGCVALVVGLIGGYLAWLIAVRRLSGRARSFISNAMYLKSL